VALRFGIVPGPGYRVRRVQITGVSEVDTAGVRRELLLEPGDLFRRERVIKSTERLYETGLFTSAEIEPVRVDTLLGQVDLNARVRERKPRWVEGGVGAGSYEKFGVSAEWGHRNLSGLGRSITADGSYGFYQAKDPYLDRMRFALAYSEPWLLGVRVRGSVVPAYERGFEVLGARTYTQRAWVLSFKLARDFTYSQSRLSLTLDNTWTTDYNVVVQDTTDHSTFFIAPYVRSWTLAYDQDRRDDPIDPRRGGLTHLSSQLAGSTEGGQGRYVKFDASSGGHMPRGQHGSLGVRLRSAWIVGVGPGPEGDAGTILRVPETDRFSLGGASSVRGYRENGIDDGGNGGRFLLNANVEARFPIRGILSGALFVDGGNVWRKMDEVKLSRMFQATGQDGTYGTADMRWSIGLGVRAHTPIGPLRLDYGHRWHTDEVDLLAPRTPQRGAWHFSIGQLF
jgi:outer membrane protein assembly factor BamA